MNKISIFYIFLILNVLSIYSQATDLAEIGEIKQSENRIFELVNRIKINLVGTSVLDSFIEEQEKWLEYRNSHIVTLFPDYIDNIKMEWGSVLSYEISQTILQMNIDRVKILEDFLFKKRQTGTDGEGRFKEYINELEMIRTNE
jgi:hypothetical protein